MQLQQHSYLLNSIWGKHDLSFYYNGNLILVSQVNYKAGPWLGIIHLHVPFGYKKNMNGIKNM